jgi:hypothetical protein
MTSLNPFGYLFATRYLAEDAADYLLYLKEKETYEKYFLDNHTQGKEPSTVPSKSAKLYSIIFSITKITKNGEYREEITSYETHYIKSSYYVDFNFVPNLSNRDIPAYKPITLKSSDNNEHYVINKSNLTYY